jgi:hypothetical protein
MASDSDNEDIESNDRPSSDVEEEEDVEDEQGEAASSEASGHADRSPIGVGWSNADFYVL